MQRPSDLIRRVRGKGGENRPTGQARTARDSMPEKAEPMRMEAPRPPMAVKSPEVYKSIMRQYDRMRTRHL